MPLHESTPMELQIELCVCVCVGWHLLPLAVPVSPPKHPTTPFTHFCASNHHTGNRVSRAIDQTLSMSVVLSPSLMNYSLCRPSIAYV